VNPLLEDFCNLEGIIDPTLGSNYHKESVAKVMKIANLSIDPRRHIRPTMHVLVNEILVALEFEEGCMGKKDAVATNVHQSALKSDTSAPLEDASKEIVVERSSVDELDFNCEHMIVDSGGENRQQPETRNAEFHGSRSVLQTVNIYHLEQEMTRGLIGPGQLQERLGQACGNW
jgi:hypothetical protein